MKPSQRRELHVYADPSGLYQGDIYIDGVKVGETGLVASVELTKQAATDEYGDGFIVYPWSQDDSIILI